MPGLTFIVRAERIDLHTATRAQTRRAVDRTARDGGRTFTEEALDLVTEASEGYPYVMQLVGHHAWRHAALDSETIGIADVEQGIVEARRRLGRTLHWFSVRDLSLPQTRVLAATAFDNGPSRSADLARRTGESGPWIGKYRKELMTLGLLRAAGHGLAVPTAPFLREFLLTHLDELLENPADPLFEELERSQPTEG
ncbi:hypothetical protein [Brevibacterium litoralis]|uniref:hypothetical protein n=1 Tax=Brevibacterium litoralis TaxID=3138935 RepID=UPI0032EAE7B6